MLHSSVVGTVAGLAKCSFINSRIRDVLECPFYAILEGNYFQMPFIIYGCGVNITWEKMTKRTCEHDNVGTLFHKVQEYL
jgi:hypothetical protein